VVKLLIRPAPPTGAGAGDHERQVSARHKGQSLRGSHSRSPTTAQHDQAALAILTVTSPRSDHPPRHGSVTKQSVRMVAVSGNLDRVGRSALHYAALEGDVSRVVELVAGGVDVDLADSAGFTGLHFAAQAQQEMVAEILLHSGASVDARDGHGRTPLWIALFNVRDGDGAVAKTLLAAGADPDVENNHGVSPRKLAETVANYDLKRFL
jgi:uncharacterized protein